MRQRCDLHDKIDHITLIDIDDNTEWLIGRMNRKEDGDGDLVFKDRDSLLWDNVVRASEAEENNYTTRVGSSTRTCTR